MSGNQCAALAGVEQDDQLLHLGCDWRASPAADPDQLRAAPVRLGRSGNLAEPVGGVQFWRCRVRPQTIECVPWTDLAGELADHRALHAVPLGPTTPTEC